MIDEPLDFQGLNEGPSFGAFTLSKGGHPLFVDNYRGILELRGEKLVERVRGRFLIRHETTMKMADGTWESAVEWIGPMGIVTPTPGRYFVSTSGVGVLELSDTGLRQMLFR